MSNERLTDPLDPQYSAASISSTGVLRTTSNLEINDDKLTVQIPGFIGYIFDEVLIKSFKIQFAGIGMYSPAYITTELETHVLVDRDGNLVATSVAPSYDDKRSHIYVCKIVHPAGIVNALVPTFDYITQESNVLGDALRFLDPVIRGCRIMPNGANLLLDVYSGSILIRSTGDKTDVLEVEEDTEISFVYSLMDGSYYDPVTYVDPDNYDNGGVLAPVPPGMFTVQRIGINRDKVFVIQYGAIVFASMASALSYIKDADVTFETEPGLANGAVLAYLAIKQGALSLIVSNEAQIHKTNNFGESVEPPSAVSSSGALLVVNDLSDLANVSEARLNLGAGSAGGLATLDLTGRLTASQTPFTKQYYANTGPLVVNNTTSVRVLESVFDTATSAGATNVRVQFYTEIVDRSLEFTIFNDSTNSLISNGSLAVSGFNNVLFTKPSSNSVLSIRMNKLLPGGVAPIVRGLTISYE